MIMLIRKNVDIDTRSLIYALMIIIDKYFDGSIELDLKETTRITPKSYIKWDYDEGNRVIYTVVTDDYFSRN